MGSSRRKHCKQRSRLAGRAPSRDAFRDGFRGYEYKQARAALRRDPSLRQGLDCCAVCCGPPLLSCPDCGRVAYCGLAHAKRDDAAHRTVCRVLSQMKPTTLDALAVEEDVAPAPAVAAKDAADALLAGVAGGPSKALSISLTASWALREFPDAAEALSRNGQLHVLGAGPLECAAPAEWWAASVDDLRKAGLLPADLRVVVTLVGPQATAAACSAPRKAGGVVVVAARTTYEARVAAAGPADVCLGFNMGLSDGAYEWRLGGVLPEGCPLVALSSTRVEARRERQALEADHGAFVDGTERRNAFHSPEWCQSGVVANDIYRKHSWAVCAWF